MPGWGGGKCPTTVPAIIFRPEASPVLAGRRCLTVSEGDFALGPALSPSQLFACCSQVTGDASRLQMKERRPGTDSRGPGSQLLGGGWVLHPHVPVSPAQTPGPCGVATG